MIKTLTLLTVAFAYALAQDVLIELAGDTRGQPTWFAPEFDGAGSCTAYSTAYPYVAFNFSFATAGVREIAAIGRGDSYDELEIYVYQGGFPATPCSNLAYNDVLGQSFRSYNGPGVDEIIYFPAGTYTLVVTGGYSNIFAVNIFPSVGQGQISGSSPRWNPPYEEDTDSSYSSYNHTTCINDDYSTSSSEYAFGTYTWTQGSTGIYDIFVMFANQSSYYNNYEVYLALYQGTPTAAQLSINICNTTATFLWQEYSSYSGTYIPYFTLTAGVTYTLAFGPSYNDFVYWAVQLVPTRVRVINQVGFTKPSLNYDTTETDSTTTYYNHCADSSNTNQYYITENILANHEVLLIAVDDAASPYHTGTDTVSYLYNGVNVGSPPTTCPILTPLVDAQDTQPVYYNTVPGQNYTLVVSTYYTETADDYITCAVYIFQGVPAGGSFSSATAATSASTSTGASSSTGATASSSSVNTLISSATTTHSASTTTSGSSSLAVSAVALVVLVISAFIL